jgi:dihydrofolate reductase
MITLVACIVKKGIYNILGKDGDLVVKLKKDVQMFKLVTSAVLAETDTKLNITVTGSKTYFSIPECYRPLRHRINFVLTNNDRLIKISQTDVEARKFDDTKPYFMNYNTFKEIYQEDTSRNFFIIGGSEIYNIFLEYWKLDKLYITEVHGVPIDVHKDNLVYLGDYTKDYTVNKISDWFKQNDICYRFLEYYPK